MSDEAANKRKKELEEWFAGAKSFCDSFEVIPNEFLIHADYLIDGITSKQWVAAYKQYQIIFRNMQAEIAANPADYGIIQPDKSGEYKVADRMVHQVLWLFVSLAQSGEIKNDILYIDGQLYLQYIQGKSIGSRDATPKRVDCLFTLLTKFDFVVESFCFGEAADFTVAAPKYPRLMTVIKASTISQYCKKGLVSDYSSFNYRIYSIAAKTPLPLEISHGYALMDDGCKAFVSGLLDYLHAHKWVRNGERYHWFDAGWLSYHKKNKWVTVDGKSLHMGCRIEFYFWSHHVHLLISGGDTAVDRAESMYALPQPYGDIWREQLKCVFCRKDECQARRILKKDGKNAAFCAWRKVHLDPDFLNDLPVILETLDKLTESEDN